MTLSADVRGKLLRNPTDTLVQVTIYRLDPIGTHLDQVSSWGSAFSAQHLRVTPSTKIYPEERLMVGDGMRSVSILDVDEGSGEIHDIQKDMATHSVVALERIRDGGEGVIIADVGCFLSKAACQANVIFRPCFVCRDTRTYSRCD